MEEKTEIYWTDIEYHLLPSHQEYGKIKGGFVFAFVQENDAKIALTKFEIYLKKEKIKAVRFKFIKPYELNSWKDKKTEKHYIEIIEETLGTPKVIFDDFYVYKEDAK